MSPKREMNRFFPLVMYLCVIAVCLGACSLGPNQGPADTPDDYNLTATVDVSHESGVDRITYEILVNEARVPMVNVIQTFTLDPNMINRIDAGEILHSNVSNTHEISLGPDKEPLGLSLSRSYVLKPKAEIDSNILQRYADMYIKISYGPNDQRTEDYFHVQAEPSPRTIEYMKSLERD
ncbi:hypothetical protein [Paenibacillus sp. VT-400]|uniref:hypothetical protein n=1 Tax=Paenibacillus sp. VT-400 TaxID=1495853 RepID=UPI000B0612C4|nr:hypothetical protein [Paenibacillus sp. VT-400]